MKSFEKVEVSARGQVDCGESSPMQDRTCRQRQTCRRAEGKMFQRNMEESSMNRKGTRE